jgi:hypothetical protein
LLFSFEDNNLASFDPEPIELKGLPQATCREITGGSVGVSEILAQIDQEIVQLQRARALLVGNVAAAPKKAAAAPATKKIAKKKKRNLSPEGRRRIAEAVKRRWAEQKKRSGSGN